MAPVIQSSTERVQSTQKRRSRPKPDIASLGGLLVAALAAALPPGLEAQSTEDPEVFGDPVVVALAFYDALASHRWAGVAATVHPETLALFRYRFSSMRDADPSGGLERLVFGDSGGTFAQRSDSEVFASLLRAVEADTPALVAVLATNQYVALGHLPEGSALAHVLLRVTPYTNGSAPTRTAVVTLKRTDSGWGILESGELDSLSTALTGLALTARSGRGATP